MNTRTTFSAGALVAPMNIMSICAAREAALTQMQDAIGTLSDGYSRALDAAETAKGATAGHSCYRTTATTRP